MHNNASREQESQEVIPARLKEILRPLLEVDPTAERAGTRSDYSIQLRDLVNTDKRCRGAETLFANAYAQVAELEKAIASCRETWQN